MDGRIGAGRHDVGEQSAAHLQRIADVLGIPLATFFDGDTDAVGHGQVAELLRLWAILDCDGDRRMVLGLLRSLENGPTET